MFDTGCYSSSQPLNGHTEVVNSLREQYKLVNKANLVHNFLSTFISFSICFGWLRGYVLIIRKNNCIFATIDICYSVWMTIWYAGWNDTLRTRQSSTQTDKYQMSHRQSHFSWWWAQSRPKHVEKRNKHAKKTVYQIGFIYKIIQGCRSKNIKFDILNIPLTLSQRI